MTKVRLKLRRFDITSIRDDKVVVLIGKRETGKSFLVRDLLYYHRDIPLGAVISDTETASPFYSEIVPSIFIHDECAPAVLQNFMDRQEMVKDKISKEKRMYGSCNIDPRAFMILDDCLYDPRWVNDKNIRRLFMNGRHYSVLFMITMQHPLGITPTLRTNIDYVFILRENIMGNRKRIYEHYAGMFPSLDVFCQVMDQCTENFECLVINNNAKSNRIQDQVFWYKAEEHGPFRMCSPCCWELCKQAEGDGEGDSDGDDGLMDLNAATSAMKRNRPCVAVRKQQF